jgi:hypothetical protein
LIDLLNLHRSSSLLGPAEFPVDELIPDTFAADAAMTSLAQMVKRFCSCRLLQLQINQSLELINIMLVIHRVLVYQGKCCRITI